MARIAIDVRKLSYPSGPGRYAHELVKNLEAIDRKNEYSIIVLKSDVGFYKPRNKNFKVVVADYPHYTFAEQWGMYRFLKKLKPDLVHYYMPQQPLLYNGASISTIHDLNQIRLKSNDMNPFVLRFKQLVFIFLLLVVAWRSKHFIAPTQFSKDDFVKFSRINPKRVSVVYEGTFEAKSLAKAKTVKQYKNTPFIMYLGRAEPYKNNRNLIKAHQELLSRYPDLRLVIVGKIDSFRQEDMAWVRDNGFKQVDFVGFMSNEEAAWLYKHSRAYVAPATMEGFGLPGLEAMAYGAPVASSNTTCLPEVYGEAAVYFNPNDPSDMAKAIEKILSNPDLSKRLVKLGKEQNKKYSWRKMAKETLVIYEQTLRNLK